MAVKFLKGGGLGSVEEAFIGRLRPHDRFQFAGRTLPLQNDDGELRTELDRHADGLATLNLISIR